MVSISEYYLQAQLSLAAYAKGLYEGMSSLDYEKALTVGGMSQAQAKDFAKNYKVGDQYTDPDSVF